MRRRDDMTFAPEEYERRLTELRERMATGDLTLIDVREPHEFAEAHVEPTATRATTPIAHHTARGSCGPRRSAHQAPAAQTRTAAAPRPSGPRRERKRR